jgi:hypothetical protein
MSRVLKTGKNQITNSYANHKGWSHGVDVVKATGQIEDIIAHTTGKVIKVVEYLTGTNKVADKEGMGYGNYVMILHDEKYQGKQVVTLYAHIAEVDANVYEGMKINKGEAFGVMGNTGNSYGAHLHFEIRLYNSTPQANSLHDTSKFVWIDPTPYLDADLPKDVVPVVGYLDGAKYENGKLVCHGWAYQGGGSKNVEIKIYKGNTVLYGINTIANKSRPDVKTAMKYSTDKLGYAVSGDIKLTDGNYTVKAFVGNKQLTNTKTITVKNELTATSYPNYGQNSGQYYRVRKAFTDAKSSQGSYWKWSGAFNTWYTWKSQGYHVYDNNGKQLD